MKTRPCVDLSNASVRGRVLSPVVVALLSLSLASAVPTARADSYYWNTATGTWQTGANWSTTATTGGTTGVVPTSADTANFNQSSVNGADTVQFSADASVGGLIFANTGTTLLDSDSATARLLTLGTGGITINSGAGAVTFGNATNTLNLALNGNQTWANNLNTSIASNTFTVVNGITASGATPVTLTVGGTSATIISGVVSDGAGAGVVSIAQTGAGKLTLSGINTYTGGTTVGSGGTVLAQNVGATNVIKGLGTGIVTLNGGNLNLRSDGTASNQVIITGNGVTGNNVVVTANSTIFVDHNTVNTGSTIWFNDLSIGAQTLSATAADSYGLKFGGVTTLNSPTSAITTFNPTSSSLYLVTVTGSATTGNVNTLNLDGTSSGNTITGIISNGAGGGTVGVSKTGSSTWALSGANTYNGGTTVSAGTLNFSGANTSTGATTVNGGVLGLISGGTLANSAATINSTGVFNVDNSSGATGSPVTRTSSLTLNGGKLAVTGSSTQNTTDNFGVLTLGQGAGVSSGSSASAAVLSGGNNVIVVSPNSGKNTRLNFTSASVNAGGTVLFSANGSSVIGANTLASATAGGINIAFTSAPSLIGDAVSGGIITTTSGIIPWAVTNAAGGTTLADFVTYDAAYGVRALTAYGSTLALSGGVAQNVKLTAADSTNNTNATVNSLILANPSANMTQNIIGTLTVNSGAVLLVPGFNVTGLSTTIAGGTLQLGTGGADGFIFMQQGRLNTISSVISGPDASHNLVLDFGNANNSGGVLVLSGNNTYAGGTIVNGANPNSALVIGGTSTLAQSFTAGTTGSFGSGDVTLNNISVYLNRSNAFTLANKLSGTGASVIQQVATGMVTLSGNISGTVAITQNNASGTMILSGNNSSTGAITNTAGTMTISGNISGGGTVTNASGTMTISGNVSGAGAVTNTAGTMVLSGTNTYTGATTLSAGTLEIDGAAAMSSGSALTITPGTNLKLRSDSTATFNPASITLASSGTLNFDVGSLTGGSGQTLTLAGALSFGSSSQQINVTDNTGDTGYVLGLGAISYNTGASGGPFNFTINATTAALQVASFTFGSYGGNLILQGGNNVSIGNMIFGSNGSPVITIAGANATFTGTNSWINSRNSGNYSVILNSGTLNMNSAGFMSNPYSGGTNASSLAINGGMLDNTSGSAITESYSAPISLGGDFTFGGTNALNLGTGAVTLTANRQITTNGTAALTLGGAVSGSGFNLTKTGSGSLRLNGAIGTGSGGVTVNGGTLTLAGNNTYTGVTSVQSGTLTLGRSGGTIADSSAVHVSGGTLDVANSDTVGAVTLSSGTISGTGILTGSSYSFTNSGTVSAVLGGSGVALAKTGAGTANLTAVNTYTGATTVTGGTLNLGVAHAVSASSNVVLGGGTLQSGFSQTLGTLNLTASSALSLSSGGTFIFADSSSLDGSWSGTLSILGTFTNNSSVRFGTGIGALTVAQLSDITINGAAAGIDANGYLFTAIPEPAAYSALLGALVMGGVIYRRRVGGESRV